MQSNWTVAFMGQNGRGYLGNGVPLPVRKARVVVSKGYLLLLSSHKFVCPVLTEAHYTW